MKKILVVGCGPAGAYLTALLSQDTSFAFKAVDDGVKNGHFCAWGVSEDIVDCLLRDIGLKLEDLTIAKPKTAIVNKTRLHIKNLAIVDKPKMLKELVKETRVLNMHLRDVPSGYDLIVDATGSAELIGEKKGASAHTVQYRVWSDTYAENSVVFIDVARGGYAWAFPLEPGYWHVGAMHVYESRVQALANTMLEKLRAEKVLCKCSCHMTLSTPSQARLVKGNVVAIGASANCVNPLSGEGIAPSMLSAKILYDSLTRGVKDYERRLKLKVAKEMKFDEAYSILAKFAESKLTPLDLLSSIKVLRLNRYVNSIGLAKLAMKALAIA